MPCEECGLNIINLVQAGSIDKGLFNAIIAKHTNQHIWRFFNALKSEDYLGLHQSTRKIPKFLYYSYHPIPLIDRR